MKKTIRYLVLALQLSLIPVLAATAGELENSLFSEVKYSSNAAKIRELLEKGANVNARESHNGKTPLIHASMNKNKGFNEVMLLLIEKGADVNAFDKDGNTALLWAAMYGLSDNVQTLIEKGADVNARNNDGVRALTWAAMYGHTNVVRLLIKNGANVNAKDSMNQTALSMAQFMKDQKDTSEVHKKALNDIIGILEQAGAR